MYRTLTYDGAGTKNQSLESWRKKRFFSKLYKDNYYVYEKKLKLDPFLTLPHTVPGRLQKNGKGKTINICGLPWWSNG